ncbi:MAG: hypothetical protein Q7J44_21770 [Pseudotabrizicola sp.]|jgi:hypothetical protein|uniref:hypothetical protein n=1 Tax=Pseudotabrizicola sp. TaxID=2939647 RepID=UPI00271BE8C0|nr:hypothetical protein [Pseudotabrizicola sp.]MDO9641164.1 hypothetical protein [Pseudotabrizicola sp.]
MKQQIGTLVRLMLTVTLAVAMLLSSNARIASHDLPELAQIVADHQTKIADHGHTHEEIVDVVHAYHGHGHDVTDHDHNTAFLLTRMASGVMQPNRSNWLVANNALPGRSVFDLDRPPRG